LHHGEDKFGLIETAEYFNKGMGNKWFTNDFDEIDSMSITQDLSFARNRRRYAKDFKNIHG